MNKILGFFLGKNVALALKFMKDLFLIFESLKAGQNPNVAPFARDLFVFIPVTFKAPLGSATEEEFIDAVFQVFKLFTKQ